MLNPLTTVLNPLKWMLRVSDGHVQVAGRTLSRGRAPRTP